MEFSTFNGVPVITYGLIGATTMFLAYSVFRDESSPKPEDTSSIFNVPSVSLPTVSLPTVSLPTVALPTAAMFATTSGPEPSKENEPEVVAEQEPESVSENTPPPPVTQGGKSKHTRNKRNKNKGKNKKNKKTKHNRK